MILTIVCCNLYQWAPPQALSQRMAPVSAPSDKRGSAAPRHSSAEVEEWQSTVASLQEELRTAHETRQEWEAQAGAARAG